MGIADWFSFESAKQRKKKAVKYYKKLYPFGKEQQAWEQSVIEEMFADKKNKKSYLFELIILREMLSNLDDPEEYDEDEEKPSIEELITLWKKTKMIYKLSATEQEKIIEIAMLEFRKESLEDMYSVFVDRVSSIYTK